MKEMIQYVKKGNKIQTKDRHGNTVMKHTKKKGMFIAFPSEDNPEVILVGWSLCNENAGDKFDKVDAYVTANSRAWTWNRRKRNYYVPDSIKGSFFGFVKRALSYFKGKRVSEWVCDVYDYDFNGNVDYPEVKIDVNFLGSNKKNEYVFCKTPNEIARLLAKKSIPGLQLP